MCVPVSRSESGHFWFVCWCSGPLGHSWIVRSQIQKSRASIIYLIHIIAESNDPRDFKQSHQHSVFIGPTWIQKAYIFYDNIYLIIYTILYSVVLEEGSNGQGFLNAYFCDQLRKMMENESLPVFNEPLKSVEQ